MLADHAEAYAGLLGEELGQTASAYTRKAALAAAALGLIVIGTVLAGVALMLWSVTPASELRAPWLLWFVPGLPIVGGFVCGLIAAKKREGTFVELKRQMAADVAMLREAGAAS